MLIPLMLGGMLLLFYQPFWGLLLLTGTIPVQAAFMVEGATLPRLLGMAVFGVWAVQKLLRRESLPELLKPALTRLALFLFALACLSTVWAEYDQGVQTRLITLFQLILLAILVFDLASSWDRIAWVARFLVMAATVAALMTLEQYFFGGARRAGGGIVGGINQTAVTMVAVLPFAFFLVRMEASGFWKLLGLAYIGLSAVAVATTLSRMNFLVFPLVVVGHLLLMTQTKAGRRQVVALGCAAVAASFFMPMEAVRDRAQSIMPYMTQTVGAADSAEGQSGRGVHMRVGLELFKDNPILGAGYRNYNPHFLTYQWRLDGADRIWRSPRSPHSSHLAFLAEFGVVGFSAWLALFGIAGVYLWKAWWNAGSRTSARTLLAQAAGFAVGLQFIYGFYSEVHHSKLFWVIMGVALAVNRVTEMEETRQADRYAEVREGHDRDLLHGSHV